MFICKGCPNAEVKVTFDPAVVVDQLKALVQGLFESVVSVNLPVEVIETVLPTLKICLVINVTFPEPALRCGLFCNPIPSNADTFPAPAHSKISPPPVAIDDEKRSIP